MKTENNFIEDIYLAMQVLMMIVLLNCGFPLFGKSNHTGMKVLGICYVIFVGIRFYKKFRQPSLDQVIDDKEIIISGLVEGLFLLAFIMIKMDSYLTLTNIVFAYVIIQIIRSPINGKYIFMLFGLSLEILMYSQSDRLILDSIGLLCDMMFIIFMTFSLSLVFKELSILQEENNYAVSKLKETNDKLGQLASTDYLTGLHNYKSFYQAISNFSVCKCRKQSTLCMAILDIDDFKMVNDTYGHPVGDSVLSAVAEKINENVRSSDFVARYGGEEFAILFPDIELVQAKGLCERLRKSIENQLFEIDDFRIRVTISVGVSRLDLLNTDVIPAFIKKVDALLYDAKSSGKNKVVSTPFAIEMDRENPSN